MRLSTNSDDRKELKKQIEGVLKGHTYDEIIDKGVEFTITKLSEVSGSDEEIITTLKQEFSDVITSDLDWVLEHLVALGRKYSVQSSSSRREDTRSRHRSDSRSRSHSSRSPSSSRSHSRFRSRSYSRSRSSHRHSRRSYSRSRSRSGNRYHSDSRNRDNYRADSRNGGRRNWNENQRCWTCLYRSCVDHRNQRGGIPNGKGPFDNAQMQQIMQILMTLPNAPKSAIQAGGETSLSQIVSEADDTRKEKEAENCIKVLHLSKKNMNILTLGGYFKRFGSINKIMLQSKSMSAIVEFSTVEEAKEALKSNTPVLNDRFIEVVSCSSKTEQEGTVEETPSESASTDPSSNTQSDEVNKKLELIRQRRLAQLMELKNKRTGIQRYHDLLVQYALLWERSKDEARLPHEDRLRSVSQKIFHDVKDVYHLVRSGVEKIENVEAEKTDDGAAETTANATSTVANATSTATEATPTSNVLDNTERAKAEVLSILDSVREAVRSTSVFEEIDKTATELQASILDEAAREMDITRSAVSGYRGRARGRGRGSMRGRSRFPRRPHVDTSKFEMDLRPNVVVLKDIEGISESEIREGLKDYQGVRSVSIENGEASIIFEKHWQTKRPITMGIPVQGKVLKPILSSEPYVAPPEPTPETTTAQ